MEDSSNLSRSEFLRQLLSQKNSLNNYGNQLVNPAVNNSDIANSATLDTSFNGGTINKNATAYNPEETVNQGNWLENGIKRIGGYIDEIQNSIMKGFFGAIEGIIDTGANIAGWFGDITGLYDSTPINDFVKRNYSDALSEWMKVYISNPNMLSGNVFKQDFWEDMGNDFVNIFTSDNPEIVNKDKYYNLDDSVNTPFDEFIMGSAQSIGFMLPSIITGGLAGGSQVASLTSMGLSATGKGAEEALSQGATAGQALASGLFSGAVEVGSELLVGKALKLVGLGTGKVMGLFGKSSAEIGTKSFIKELAQTMFEEGTEEVFSALFEPITKAVYQGKEAFKDSKGNNVYLSPEFWWGEDGHFNESVLGQFASGAFVGGLSGGAQQSIIRVKTGKYGSKALSYFGDIAEHDQTMKKLELKHKTDTEQYRVAKEARAKAMSDFIEAEDALLKKGTQEQIENFAKYLGVKDALFEDLKKQNQEDANNILKGYLKAHREGINTHSKESLNTFFREIQEKYGTDIKLEFVEDLRDINGAKADAYYYDKDNVIRIDTKALETKGGQLLVHEYFGHALSSAMTQGERITFYNEIKNAIGEDLENSIIEEYKDLHPTKKQIREEVIAHFLQNTFSGDNVSIELNKAKQIFGNRTFTEKVLDVLNKRTFKGNKITREYAKTLNNFLNNANRKDIKLVAFKSLMGETLTKKEERLNQKYSNIVKVLKDDLRNLVNGKESKVQIAYSKQLAEDGKIREFKSKNDSWEYEFSEQDAIIVSQSSKDIKAVLRTFDKLWNTIFDESDFADNPFLSMEQAKDIVKGLFEGKFSIFDEVWGDEIADCYWNYLDGLKKANFEVFNSETHELNKQFWIPEFYMYENEYKAIGGNKIRVLERISGVSARYSMFLKNIEINLSTLCKHPILSSANYLGILRHERMHFFQREHAEVFKKLFLNKINKVFKQHEGLLNDLIKNDPHKERYINDELNKIEKLATREKNWNSNDIASIENIIFDGLYGLNTERRYNGKKGYESLADYLGVKVRNKNISNIGKNGDLILNKKLFENNNVIDVMKKIVKDYNKESILGEIYADTYGQMDNVMFIYDKYGVNPEEINAIVNEFTDAIAEEEDTHIMFSKPLSNGKDAIESPIIRQGKKYNLIDKVFDETPKPKEIKGNFIDAFSGSGTVAINANLLGYKNISANELDPAIYGLQLEFKNNSPEFIIKYIKKRIKEYNLREAEGFNKFVEHFNNEGKNDEHHYLDLFIIQRFSFVRDTSLNDEGKFEGWYNTSRKDSVFADKNFKYLTPKIKNFHDNLQNVELTNKNAFQIIAEAKEGDFLYLDPPYGITNATYNRGWTEKDDLALVDALMEATDRGVKWEMSNALSYDGRTNDIISALSEYYDTKHLDMKYAKGIADEIIIRNYDNNGDIIENSSIMYSKNLENLSETEKRLIKESKHYVDKFGNDVYVKELSPEEVAKIGTDKQSEISGYYEGTYTSIDEAPNVPIKYKASYLDKLNMEHYVGLTEKAFNERIEKGYYKDEEIQKEKIVEKTPEQIEQEKKDAELAQWKKAYQKAREKKIKEQQAQNKVEEVKEQPKVEEKPKEVVEKPKVEAKVKQEVVEDNATKEYKDNIERLEEINSEALSYEEYMVGETDTREPYLSKRFVNKLSHKAEMILDYFNIEFDLDNIDYEELDFNKLKEIYKNYANEDYITSLQEVIDTIDSSEYPQDNPPDYEYLQGLIDYLDNLYNNFSDIKKEYNKFIKEQQQKEQPKLETKVEEPKKVEKVNYKDLFIGKQIKENEMDDYTHNVFDSKIDVYHGTMRSFELFDNINEFDELGEIKTRNGLYYFTDSKEYATNYANKNDESLEMNPRIIKANLKAKKIIYIDANFHYFKDIDATKLIKTNKYGFSKIKVPSTNFESNEIKIEEVDSVFEPNDTSIDAIVLWAKQQNYDGIAIYNVGDTFGFHNEFVVFDNKNITIKSNEIIEGDIKKSLSDDIPFEIDIDGKITKIGSKEIIYEEKSKLPVEKKEQPKVQKTEKKETQKVKEVKKVAKEEPKKEETKVKLSKPKTTPTVATPATPAPAPKPTFKSMKTTKEIVETARDMVKSKFTDGTYSVAFPVNIDNFVGRSFDEINSKKKVSAEAKALAELFGKTTINKLNPNTNNYEKVGTLEEILSTTEMANLTTALESLITGSKDTNAVSEATRVFEKALDKARTVSNKYNEKGGRKYILGNLRNKLREKIGRFGEITDKLVEKQGLNVLLSPFAELHSDGKSSFKAKEFRDNINKVLSIYNEENIDKNFKGLPYDENVRQALQDVYDSLGEPVEQVVNKGKPNEKTRVIYGSLTAEQMQTAIDAIRVIRKFISDTQTKELTTIRPSIRATIKRMRSMSFGKKNNWIAKLYRAYKRGFAPAYVVIEQMFGGNTEASRILTTDMQRALNTKIKYVGDFSVKINNKLKELGIRKTFDTKTFDLNGETISADKLLNLYINLNTEANYNAIDEVGLQFYDSKTDKLTEPKYKGEASALKEQVIELLPKEYQELGDWLLEEINNGIKKEYIKMLEDRYGAYTSRNEIGAIGDKSYWMLNRSYQKMTNIEKVIKNPSALFSHAKSRTNTQNQVLIAGALSGFTTYVEQLASEMYVKPVYRDALTLLNTKTELGENGRTIIEEMATNLEPQEKIYLETTLKDILGKNESKQDFFTKAMSTFSVAKLSLNIGSMLKQFASILTSNIPLRRSIKGFISNLFKSDDVKAEYKALVEELGGLKYRESSSAVVKANVDTVSGKFSEIAEKGMFGISKMDLLTISTGVVSLIHIAQDQFGYKINTKENINFVKEHWLDFELSQIGNGALSKNAISRGDHGAITKGVFVFLQGANRANFGSQLHKLGLWGRNRKVNITELTKEYEASKQALNDFLTENGITENDLGSLDDTLKDEYMDLKEKVIDLENKIADYKKFKLAGGNFIITNMLGGLVAQGIFVALINELMKHIKGKKDWDEWDIAELGGNTLLATLVDWIPFVNTASNLVKGYEVNVPAVEILNGFGEIFQNINSGNYNSSIKQIALLVGDMTGIPVQTITDYIYGALNTFDPQTAYEMKNVLYGSSSQSLNKTINSYVDKGKTSQVEKNVKLLITNYKTGYVSDSVNKEISSLKIAGYNAYPKNYLTKYTDSKGNEVELTANQIATFKQLYSTSDKAVNKLITTVAYRNLTQEEKAKAISKLYDAYYDYAKGKLLNQMPSNKIAKILYLTKGRANLGNLVSILQKASTITETKRKTRKELVVQYINSQAISGQEKVLVMYLMGYGLNDNNKARLKSYLSSLGVNYKDIKEMLN